jgi:hypothetical protein
MERLRRSPAAVLSQGVRDAVDDSRQAPATLTVLIDGTSIEVNITRLDENGLVLASFMNCRGFRHAWLKQQSREVKWKSANEAGGGTGGLRQRGAGRVLEALAGRRLRSSRSPSPGAKQFHITTAASAWSSGMAFAMW